MPKRRERVGADANLTPTRSTFAARENRGVWCQAVSGTDRLSVPCPTTILTVGLLLVAASRSWSLAIVPMIWSVIGVPPRFFWA